MNGSDKQAANDASIQWREPWYPVTTTEDQRGIQEELEREIGPHHPLWDTNPVVIGKRKDRDDVAVRLTDGRFAIVHLVWNGQIDRFTGRYPSNELFDSRTSFQAAIEAR